MVWVTRSFAACRVWADRGVGPGRASSPPRVRPDDCVRSPGVHGLRLDAVGSDRRSLLDEPFELGELVVGDRVGVTRVWEGALTHVTREASDGRDGEPAIGVALDEARLVFLASPGRSWKTSTWPSQPVPAPMPMVGMQSSRVMRDATGESTASSTSLTNFLDARSGAEIPVLTPFRDALLGPEADEHWATGLQDLRRLMHCLARELGSFRLVWLIGSGVALCVAASSDADGGEAAAADGLSAWRTAALVAVAARRRVATGAAAACGGILVDLRSGG
jgi:hypothetical protein